MKKILYCLLFIFISVLSFSDSIDCSISKGTVRRNYRVNYRYIDNPISGVNRMAGFNAECRLYKNGTVYYGSKIIFSGTDPINSFIHSVKNNQFSENGYLRFQYYNYFTDKPVLMTYADGIIYVAGPSWANEIKTLWKSDMRVRDQWYVRDIINGLNYNNTPRV